MRTPDPYATKPAQSEKRQHDVNVVVADNKPQIPRDILARYAIFNLCAIERILSNDVSSQAFSCGIATTNLQSITSSTTTTIMFGFIPQVYNSLPRRFFIKDDFTNASFCLVSLSLLSCAFTWYRTFVSHRHRPFRIPQIRIILATPFLTSEVQSSCNWFTGSSNILVAYRLITTFGINERREVSLKMLFQATDLATRNRTLLVQVSRFMHPDSYILLKLSIPGRIGNENYCHTYFHIPLDTKLYFVSWKIWEECTNNQIVEILNMNYSLLSNFDILNQCCKQYYFFK